MITPGTPVRIVNNRSAMAGRSGIATTYPHPATGTVLVRLDGNPVSISFGMTEVEVDGCVTCARTKQGAFAPRHQASTRCTSGGRAHCSCDTCF